MDKFVPQVARWKSILAGRYCAFRVCAFHSQTAQEACRGIAGGGRVNP
jgi:hypothetical protein